MGTCPCGHSEDSPAVVQKLDYTPWGWFVILILNISVMPTALRWVCKKCGHVFREERRASELEKHRYRGMT